MSPTAALRPGHLPSASLTHHSLGGFSSRQRETLPSSLSAAPSPCKLLLLLLEDSSDVAAVIYGRQGSLGLNEAQQSAVWRSTDEGNVNVTSSELENTWCC